MKRLNQIRNLPIAVYIWTLGLLMVAIFSIVFMTAYHVISSSLMESNIAYTAQVFSQFQDVIRDNSEFLQQTVQNMAYNRTTAKYIIEDDPHLQFENIQNMDNLVLSNLQMAPAIKEVIVEGNNGSFYSLNGRTPEVLEVLENLPEAPNFYYDFSQHLYYRDEKTESFLLTTALYDIWNYTRRYDLGRMTVVVDMEILGVQEFSDQYGMGIYLLDPAYELAVSNQEVDEVAKYILEKVPELSAASRMEMSFAGEIYIVNYEEVPTIGCHLVSILPKSSITESLNWMQETIFWLLLPSLAVMMALMIILHHKITSPLQTLAQYIIGMQNQTTQYLKKEIRLNGYREIVQISGEYNRMIEEIRGLTHQLVHTTSTLYEAELQKKQSELLYLRSEINPHFLYNTLESIMGMAYLENAPQTAQMVKNLGKIFKYSVKGQDMVPVQEELSTIQAYLSIQQMRFEGMFEVQYQIAPALLDCRIPKMILQPLVENAITHGLEPKGSDGLLILGGLLKKDEKICLWVEDNGVGMQEDQQEYFQKLIDKYTYIKTDSIGIENVVNRLQLLYGAGCAIRLNSRAGYGTRIELEIPLFRSIAETQRYQEGE